MRSEPAWPRMQILAAGPMRGQPRACDIRATSAPYGTEQEHRGAGPPVRGPGGAARGGSGLPKRARRGRRFPSR
jgi:hypothetical protein